MSQSAVFRLSTEKSTLANGTTLLFTPIVTAPRLAFSFFLPGGNMLDTVAGAADFADRLLLKGTKTRSQEQISIELDGLTLELDTDTKRDYTVLHATMLEEDLETSFELIADFFYNATFADFEREKQKISGEIMMELDSPKSRAADQFIRKLFEDTPYGTVSSLMLEQIPSMTSVQPLLDFYREAFNPATMIASVAGNITASKVAALIEKTFPATNTEPSATFSAHIASAEAKIRARQLESDTVLKFARDDSSQAHIFKGWLMPDNRHEDYPALSLLNNILGAAGLSSRLFLELRDKQGLAYNVRSTLEAYRNKGLFYLYIGTEPKNLEKCLKGFIEEVDKLLNIPVDADELAAGKRNLLGRRSVVLETAHQQANYIGANYTLGRSLADIEMIPSKIEAVTSADIQRVAQKYLTQPSVTSIVAASKFL